MTQKPLPFRLSADGQAATWNPGLTRATQVVLVVRDAAGAVEQRRTMNSGRARVRAGERIHSVLAPEEPSGGAGPPAADSARDPS